MTTGRRPRGRLHLAQQRVHLRVTQAASGANAAVAGQAGDHGIEPGGQGHRFIEFGQLVSDVSDQRGGLRRAQSGGQGADQNGARSKDSISGPEARQVFGAGQQTIGVGLRQSTTAGISNGWAAAPPSSMRVPDRFMGQPLMRGVLIDQNQGAIAATATM